MNHCLLEVEVLELPQLRYTQDNQTPVAEMTVQFEGLRPDDPSSQLKVVGWGNLAQELQGSVQVGQKLVLEGRLRMNTVSRQDGVKEKRAELTLARLHPLSGAPLGAGSQAPAPRQAARVVAAPARQASPSPAPAAAQSAASPPAASPPAANPPPATWNTSPLVPDLIETDDEIPF
ncbi:MAG: single-stranded DNA-binding protein [Prochlorococcaceae cyanobacterium]